MILGGNIDRPFRELPGYWATLDSILALLRSYFELLLDFLIWPRKVPKKRIVFVTRSMNHSSIILLVHCL